MLIRSILFLAIALSVQPLQSQQSLAAGLRDPLLRDVLSRVIGAAGGPAITSVQNLSESGQITFHWAQDVTGSVAITLRDDCAFRMDANLPEGKRTIVIKGKEGSDRQGTSIRLIPADGVGNFCHLTFPMWHVIAAIAQKAATISSFTLDNGSGTPAYRIRIEEHPLTPQSAVRTRAVKEVLVDPMTFDILRVDDYPFDVPGAPKPQSPPRSIEYSDYRVVEGIRVPYSVSTILQGQRTLTIHVDNITVNTNVSDSLFVVEHLPHR